MISILGYSSYSGQALRSPSPPIRNISRFQLQRGIYDEIHMRENISQNVDFTSKKNRWQDDTRLLARFLGDLEAGNVQNEGVQIEQFAIKRRKVNEFDNVTLGYRPFVNDSDVSFKDYTQSNDRYIYSIVPVGENNLEGRPNEVQIESDFVGWWIVDKDNDEVIGFDKFLNGNEEMVSTQLNQGRVQLQTMTKYPSVFYTDQEYNEFSLKATFIPEEWERTGHKYEEFIDKFIRNHKPFIVKGSDGSIYVADIHNPRKTTPQNTWKNYDYTEIEVDCVEIQDYNDFMRE